MDKSHFSINSKRGHGHQFIMVGEMLGCDMIVYNFISHSQVFLILNTGRKISISDKIHGFLKDLEVGECLS